MIIWIWLPKIYRFGSVSFRHFQLQNNYLQIFSFSQYVMLLDLLFAFSHTAATTTRVIDNTYQKSLVTNEQLLKHKLALAKHYKQTNLWITIASYIFSFFIKITHISYFIERFFPNFTCKFDIQICLSIRLSIALKLPITLTTRKKGEKTVAPRGPTPSFSRDVGGNQGKFLSEILYQNIMYELKKYFIWSVENRPMFLFYCNFSSNCWLLDMVVSICVAANVTYFDLTSVRQ